MTDVSLKSFSPTNLMNSVKARGESLFELREHEDKMYYISVHFERIIGVINKDTEYYIDIVSEDLIDGQQKRLSNCGYLKDYQVVGKLEELKYKILNNLELN